MQSMYSTALADWASELIVVSVYVNKCVWTLADVHLSSKLYVYYMYVYMYARFITIYNLLWIVFVERFRSFRCQLEAYLLINSDTFTP